MKEFAIHPDAELIDYYKLFFQAIYGPGHLIDSREQARFYLQTELRQFEGNEEPHIQDISYAGRDYCRVNLQVIKKGLIGEDDFLERFINSVRDPNDGTCFIEVWDVLAELIGNLEIPDDDYVQQLAQLQKMLRPGRLLHPSHSYSYKQAYNPHYRLIRKKFICDIVSVS